MIPLVLKLHTYFSEASPKFNLQNAENDAPQFPEGNLYAVKLHIHGEPNSKQIDC